MRRLYDDSDDCKTVGGCCGDFTTIVMIVKLLVDVVATLRRCDECKAVGGCSGDVTTIVMIASNTV